MRFFKCIPHSGQSPGFSYVLSPSPHRARVLTFYIFSHFILIRFLSKRNFLVLKIALAPSPEAITMRLPYALVTSPQANIPAVLVEQSGFIIISPSLFNVTLFLQNSVFGKNPTCIKTPLHFN
jgi:hypothetical protein